MTRRCNSFESVDFGIDTSTPPPVASYRIPSYMQPTTASAGRSRSNSMHSANGIAPGIARKNLPDSPRSHRGRRRKKSGSSTTSTSSQNSVRRHSRKDSIESASSVDTNPTSSECQETSIIISPRRADVQTETPEWKKRLVDGQLGYNEKRDLFEPNGLESLFNRPATPATTSLNVWSISPNELAWQDLSTPLRNTLRNTYPNMAHYLSPVNVQIRAVSSTQLEIQAVDNLLPVSATIRCRAPTPEYMQCHNPRYRVSSPASARHSSFASDMFDRQMSRKASFNTREYVAEVEAIMANIRDRSRAGEPTTMSIVEETLPSESTPERFTRPPSREGGMRPLYHSSPVYDSATLNLLNRFRETSGTFGPTPPPVPAPKPLSPSSVEKAQSFNSGRCSRCGCACPACSMEEPKLLISRPQTSGRGLGLPRVIAPESVRHLIPTEFGDMLYDSRRQIWVKSNDYEDFSADPFVDISDLSVDTEVPVVPAPVPDSAGFGTVSDIDISPKEPTGDSAGHDMLPLRGSIFKPVTVEEVPDEEGVGGPPDGAQVPGKAAENERIVPIVEVTLAENSDDEDQMSPSEDVFLARPILRNVGHAVQEAADYEISADQDRLLPSVNLVLTTPIRRSGVGSSMLELTPLSDFSLSKPDPSLLVDADYPGYGRPKNSTKVDMSLTVKRLVKRLTDVIADDLEWDQIQEIDLSGKRLRSLFWLDRYCPRLTKINLSDNNIEFLGGLPMSVRHLILHTNSLSHQTTIHTLTNLQYLDLSNNALKDLHGLSGLFHLRTLIVDNNELVSLNGLETLETLENLSASNNMIEFLDFVNYPLQQLKDLNLKGNEIRDIRGLNTLKSLASLDLDDNLLEEFPVPATTPLISLAVLKLRRNRLKQFKVQHMTKLRILHLDSNCLSRVDGLSMAGRIDTLSIRQQDCESFDVGFVNEAFEVRKLYLAGNPLHDLNLEFTFMNLQYLELANTGITYLQPDFAARVPNLRVLCLNHNAVEDISPIKGIDRLVKLYLAGNRVRKSAMITQVVKTFRYLREVDLRNNPITIGFYPMATVPSGEQFMLPHRDDQSDKLYTKSLDQKTRQRKTIYEGLLLIGTRLRLLDGLAVNVYHRTL